MAATFEQVRQTYFINPKEAVHEDQVQAITNVAEQLLGLQGDRRILSQDHDALGTFVQALVDRMRGSRKFDHLSVAQIHPDGNLPAMLAHMASTMRNNNTIIGEASPVETRMEQEAMAWIIKEIARFDEHEASGAITTGGTLANLTGLMVAREKLLQDGWDGRSTVSILTTHMAHYSVKKAAAVLGPRGLIDVLEIPMEEGSYKMDVHALEHYVAACKKLNQRIMAIVGVAGETETGLVDDLQRIAEIAEANHAYFHVDGAYGAPFVLSSRRQLFDGMNRGNSLVVDPHKYMYTPYAAGAVIFRSAADHALIEPTNDAGAGYMFKDAADRGAHRFKQESQTHLGRRRIEGSMGGQAAAAVWAVINTLGVEGLGLILNHTLEVTKAVHAHVEASRVFTPAHEPDLNTLCFYPCDPRIKEILANPHEQARLVETASAILEDRTGAYLSTTKLPVPTGRDNQRTDLKVYRFVATHPWTDIADATGIIDNLHNIWDELVVQEQAKLTRRSLG